MARQITLFSAGISPVARPTVGNGRPKPVSNAKDICEGIIDGILTDIFEKPRVEKATRRIYRPEWQQGFPWLVYEEGRMFCKLCRLYKSGTVFGTNGAG